MRQTPALMPQCTQHVMLLKHSSRHVMFRGQLTHTDTVRTLLRLPTQNHIKTAIMLI